MQELYKEGNTLVSLAKWQEAISSLDITPSSLAQISTAFEQAVLRRVPKEPFGLFLSGGVDSTLIAHILKKHNHSPICFTVGTKDSQDIEFAKRVAGGLSLEHHIVTLDDQDIKSIIQELKVIFKDHIASNPSFFRRWCSRFRIKAGPRSGLNTSFQVLARRVWWL